MPSAIDDVPRSFFRLKSDYNADDPDPEFGPWFVLHCGDDIVAVLIKEKFNRAFPLNGEIWIGNHEHVADWGDKLAALRNTDTTLPLYFRANNSSGYVPKGRYRVIGDTQDASKLAITKDVGALVPLSRIVYVKPA